MPVAASHQAPPIVGPAVMQDLGHPAARQRRARRALLAVRRSHNPATPHHLSAGAPFLPNRRLRRPDRPIHDASSSTTGFDKANAPACSLGAKLMVHCDASPGGKHVS